MPAAPPRRRHATTPASFAPLDVGVVVRGAALHFGLSLPAPILVGIVRRDDLDARSWLWIVALGTLLAAPAAGGWYVGRSKPVDALSNGLAGGGAGAALVIAFGFTRRLLAGQTPNVVSLLLLGVVQTSVAFLVAFAAASTRRDPQSTPAPNQAADPPDATAPSPSPGPGRAPTGTGTSS